MRISDWSSDVCSSDLCRRSPSFDHQYPALYSAKLEPFTYHPPYRLMTTRPQPAKYHPEAAILSLGGKIGEPVTPADLPAKILHFRNDRWDAAVGLGGRTSEEWVAQFGQFQALSVWAKETLS